MIIRTKEQFYEQLEKHKNSLYLPIRTAFALPQIVHDLNQHLTDRKKCEKAIVKINKVLRDPKYHAVGFVKKGTACPLHECEAKFEELVHTFGEDRDGIYGRDSIGIHFTDPDDGYNDWIWIAYEVINELAFCSYDEYKEKNLSIDADPPACEPPKHALRKGFRIVKVNQGPLEWFELQRKTWYGKWKNAVGNPWPFPGRIKFSSLDNALAEYNRLFGIPTIEVLTTEEKQ